MYRLFCANIYQILVIRRLLGDGIFYFRPGECDPSGRIITIFNVWRGKNRFGVSLLRTYPTLESRVYYSVGCLELDAYA